MTTENPYRSSLEARMRRSPGDPSKADIYDEGYAAGFAAGRAAATPDPPTDERRPWPIAPDTVMPPRRQPVRWGSRADDPPTEIHDDPGKTKAYLAGLAAGRTEAPAASPDERLREENLILRAKLDAVFDEACDCHDEPHPLMSYADNLRHRLSTTGHLYAVEGFKEILRERDELRAADERLREAGDAMAAWLAADREAPDKEKRSCGCVMRAHCNHRDGCALDAGGTVNDGGGVCPAADRDKEARDV